MKHTRIRAVVLYLFVLIFFVGISVFIFKFITDVPNWAMHSNNIHMKNGISTSGKIFDRNGEVLAKSVDSKRVYSGDENVRKALLHIVGDGYAAVNSSVQSCYCNELFGYNMITGFGAPPFFNRSKNILLTIDSNISKQVYLSLCKYKGAAAAYNYKTGEIICMVSSPSYDPANKPDIDGDTSGRYEGVYINRAVSASYTPGSIFKVVTSAAAIDNISDLDKRKFYCNGEKVIDGERIVCHSKHGTLNFRDAMAKSCNIAMGELAVELGKDKMMSVAESLGFNKEFSVDNIKIEKSYYDVKNTNNIDLAWSGIGQYTDLTNTVHMMILMGAIANSGTPVKPYIIENISSNLKSLNSAKKAENLGRMMNESTALELKKIMGYTAKTYGIFSDLNICAKTGTGEVGDDKANGWIVGFIKDERYPIAFAVVTEKSGYGISTAAPIARTLVERIMSLS